MPSWLRVAAERTVSRAMGGSCSMPLAAYADWTAEGTLRLDAAWGDPEGVQRLVRVHDSAPVDDLTQAEALGQRVAQALRSAGAQPPSGEA
jgi:hydroxymethylbilane synthase